jgi:6-phospho-3-hexuloisomerase
MTRGLSDALVPLARVLARVRRPEVLQFEKTLLAARRVFVTGLGRTGLMARGFAMRLMHLGRRVYHVGDVITPAIRRGDLLVICSRTGRSPVLLYYVRIAKETGARVALVTADRTSPVARHSDAVLVIPSESSDGKPARKTRKPAGRPGRTGRSEPPLGSVFEQALLVVLDEVVVRLMEPLGLNPEDLRRIHTTFE